MVKVRFTTREFDEAADGYTSRVRAELTVDGRNVSIEGDRRWVSLEVGVVDPETRDYVTFDKDPERWASLLPLAYRSGDITVETTETEGAMTGVPALTGPAVAAGSGRRA